MPKIPLDRHPHLLRCPHCGADWPEVSVEQDMLKVWTFQWQAGEVAIAEGDPSYLDNVEYFFRCCSSEVHDSDLIAALDYEVFGTL